MVHSVSLGEMKTSSHPDDLLVTPPLGAGLAILLHDPAAGIGGLLHFLLPLAELNPERATESPHLFADTGIPRLIRAALALGASRRATRLAMVGGAHPVDATEIFALGERNQAIARRIAGREDFAIEKEAVGGTDARRARLDVGSGRIWVSCRGEEFEL
jgi:chemotaxis protein CheD